jgi:aspartyl-tRNA(Asn)/glutamyl-tRNA(Gln) amidotransferase subunit B
MKDYKLTVGLEIHAELDTKTKMFCDSSNDRDESRPNHNICPVCLGYPGTLPVINKEAVRAVLSVGTAVGGELADYAEFDRKNYFYPDIPKGYQISQHKHPLVRGGELAGVALTRIHLEEDTAKSIHTSTGESLLDFNRAGVPLMEMVTEPVIHDAEAAARFAKELQLLLTTLGVSSANMEKGELRLEANISVSKDGKLGTKVEVKNLNSFKAVEKAIRYEYERQTALLEKGEAVIQETRGWDENRGESVSQRKKEESHDYRYFPEPDLPKLFINELKELSHKSLTKSMPELPWAKRERLAALDISLEHAEVYVTQPEWGTFFEEVVAALKDKSLIQLASNYITSDLKKFISPESFSEVIRMLSKGEISSRAAKDILKIIQEEGGEPKVIAQEKNLMQESDREVLKKIIEEVRREHPDAPVQFLVGQAMKKSGGRANPVILQELFLVSDH